jgi:chromosomal replication initiation ATPase DnaA
MNAYAIPGIRPRVIATTYMNEEQRQAFAKKIIEVVANFYNVKLEKVMKKDRSGDLPKVCQISSYLINKKLPMYKLKEIAAFYGKRYTCAYGIDHSAIIHNKTLVQGWIDVGDALSKDVAHLDVLVNE